MTRWSLRFRQPTPWLLLLCLILSACQRLPYTPQSPSTYAVTTPTNQQALRDFDSWLIQGKLAVRTADDSRSAIIQSWQQDGKSWDIRVASPFLGLGATRLRGQPGRLEVLEPGEPPHVSRHPQSLLDQTLGWHLPLEHLVWWVRGLPAPDEAFRRGDDDSAGQKGSLQQAEWDIEWTGVVPLEGPAQTLFLPRRITLKKDIVQIRMIITSWQIPEHSRPAASSSSPSASDSMALSALEAP